MSAGVDTVSCVIFFLSGKLDSCVAPWFCGVPLTAWMKLSGGFCPIPVGETLRHPVSKVCCFVVGLALPDLFLPFGQGGIL